MKMIVLTMAGAVIVASFVATPRPAMSDPQVAEELERVCEGRRLCERAANARFGSFGSRQAIYYSHRAGSS